MKVARTGMCINLRVWACMTESVRGVSRCPEGEGGGLEIVQLLKSMWRAVSAGPPGVRIQ